MRQTLPAGTPSIRSCVKTLWTISLIAAGAGTVSAQGATADLTVLNAGRIHTMDVARPRAQALAYDVGGRILALGDTA